jgi:hypothetical protein
LKRHFRKLNRRLTPRVSTACFSAPFAAVLLAAALALAPAPARAQDYTWTLSVMGGLGGALESGGGGAETGFQVGFGLQFEPGANVWAHFGQLDFETGTGVGELTDGTISYFNLGGEYLFAEGYYDSGVFLGLGLYDLEGRRVLAPGVLAPSSSDSVIGLVLGATGEFKITPSFVFLAEVSGHVLDSDDLRILGTGFAGFGLHF